MGRQKRTFTPRVRTTRPLGVPITPNQAPGVPLEAPFEKDGHWCIPAPLASRLHQKSALGRTEPEGGIYLTSEEILFCHWHRHVPLPSEDWFAHSVESDPDLVARAVAFDVARSGGELIVPVANLSSKRNFSPSGLTWALRWNREQNFSKEDPVAHVRWVWTTDDVNWPELEAWTADVTSRGMLAELFVIDEELDVTMYRLGYAEIAGDQATWPMLSPEQIEALRTGWSSRIPRGEGWYIPSTGEWPWGAIGVEHLSGRHLRNEEGLWLSSKLGETSMPHHLSLYSDLMARGVVLRPGFKFGSQWRIYDAAVGEAHAPWLLLPSERAPVNWNGACLSVRLAEGVHKVWVCAFENGSTYRYLKMQRWLPGR